MRKAGTLRVALAALLVACGPLAASASARQHVVVEIRTQPGSKAGVGATVTLSNGHTEPLTVHQTLPDGARIDVPTGITVVIQSTDKKSTATLRPDTSFILVATGAGERSTVAHGSVLFSVVHGALDFFQVRYGTAFFASARGTVFTVDASERSISFSCERGVVDVAFAAKLKIGTLKRAPRAAPTGIRRDWNGTAGPVTAAPTIRSVEVIGSAHAPRVTFPIGAREFVKKFATADEAQSFFDAEMIRARQSGDSERIAAAVNNVGTVAHAKGEYARAIGAFSEAIRLDPRDAIAYYNRGNTYWTKGDYVRAIADYDEAIRLDPKAAEAYTNR